MVYLRIIRFESLRRTVCGELRFQFPSRAVEAKAVIRSSFVGVVGRRRRLRREAIHVFWSSLCQTIL